MTPAVLFKEYSYFSKLIKCNILTFLTNLYCISLQLHLNLIEVRKIINLCNIQIIESFQ